MRCAVIVDNMDKHKAIVHIAHKHGKGKSVGQTARANVDNMGHLDKYF